MPMTQCAVGAGLPPHLAKIVEAVPEGLAVQRILGGLAPDSEEPMPRQMQLHLQDTWRRVQQRIPGTRFDFAFWERCAPDAPPIRHAVR